MTLIPGTLVLSPITPGNDAATYGTHHSTLGVGGYMEIEDDATRNAIPVDPTVNKVNPDGYSSGRRRHGMLVYVRADDKFYQLWDTDWGTYTFDSQKYSSLSNNSNWRYLPALSGAVSNDIPLSGTAAGAPVTGGVEMQKWVGRIYASDGGPIAEYVPLNQSSTYGPNWNVLRTYTIGSGTYDNPDTFAGIFQNPTSIYFAAQNIAGGFSSRMSLDTSLGLRYSSNVGGFGIETGSFYGTIKSDNLTATRTYQLPDIDGSLESVANKAVANGYASLDGSGKVPTSQLPAGIVGAMQYQGLWNASTNTPALVSGVGSTGYFYKVSVSGATTIDGNTNWHVGDWIVFNGTTWDKVDNYEAVTTVFGRVGDVSLLASDVTGALTYTPANAATTFVNGGNSFAGNATLGTNDDFTLAFKTNNVTALSFDTSQIGTFSSGFNSNSGRLLFTGNANNALSSFSLTTGSTTNGSNSISFDSNTVVKSGDTITGTGIPTGTYVLSTTGTTAILSANATVTNTGLTFTVIPITFGVNISQSQTGVLNQTSAGLYLNPIWTNSSNDNRALYISYTGSSSTSASAMEIVGNGGVENLLMFRNASNATSAVGPYQLGIGAGGSLAPSGYLFLAKGTSSIFQVASNSFAFSSGVLVGGGSSTVTFKLGGGIGASNSGTSIGLGSATAQSIVNFTPTSGAVTILGIGNSSGWSNQAFAPTSGSASYANITLDPIINQTISATGTIRGIYYNPTATSILGTHYAFEATLGIVKIGDTTASSSTTTGALIVSGGVGIAKRLYVGDAVNITTSNVTSLVVSCGGATVATYSGTNIGGNVSIDLYHNATGNTANKSQYSMSVNNGSGTQIRSADILGGLSTITAGSEIGVMSLRTYSGGALASRLDISSSAINAYNITNFNINLGTTTAATNALTITNTTFNPTSGGNSYVNLLISSTYNQTSTATGNIYGIYYNPTVTSVLGTHYALYASTGSLYVSPTLDTTNQIGRLETRSSTGSLYLSHTNNAGSSTNYFLNTNGSTVNLNATGGNSINFQFGGTTAVSLSSASMNMTGSVVIVQAGSYTASSGSKDWANILIGGQLNTTGTWTGTLVGMRVSPYFLSTTGSTSSLIVDFGTNSATGGSLGTHTSYFSIDNTGKSVVNGLLKLKRYTTAGLPTPGSGNTDCIVVCSDGGPAGIPIPVYSDGSHWYKFDGTVVV